MAKRAYKIGKCADCAGQMKMAAPNQKYCSACRIGRNAEWHDGRPSACPTCSEPMIAWAGPSGGGKGTPPRCGKCLIALAPLGLRESVEGTCGWHAKGSCSSPHAPTTVVYSADLALCFPCLTDPEKFKLNRVAILAKYAALRARERG